MSALALVSIFWCKTSYRREKRKSHSTHHATLPWPTPRHPIPTGTSASRDLPTCPGSLRWSWPRGTAHHGLSALDHQEGAECDDFPFQTAARSLHGACEISRRPAGRGESPISWRCWKARCRGRQHLQRPGLHLGRHMG